MDGTIPTSTFKNSIDIERSKSKRFCFDELAGFCIQRLLMIEQQVVFEDRYDARLLSHT